MRRSVGRAHTITKSEIERRLPRHAMNTLCVQKTPCTGLSQINTAADFGSFVFTNEENAPLRETREDQQCQCPKNWFS
jgi:hypothetical protein